MTAVRLSPLQRQVLDQLAHMRVDPRDAVMTTRRLSVLTNRNLSRTNDTMERLFARGLVSRRWDQWRITDKGREALG